MKNEIAFTEEECEYIIKYTNNLKKVKEKNFLRSYGLYSDEISYDVWNINRNEETQWIFDKLNLFLSNEIHVEIQKELTQIHIHKYTIGEKFTRHSDSYYPTQQHNVGVCLNDDYDGGEFVLYNPDYILSKKTGKIYTFESRREHEVKEILSGERWSIIAFYHSYNLKYITNKII